jgi:type IV pilus assembly protein PilM
MAKNQAVWALDIGQAALKALKLVPGARPGPGRGRGLRLRGISQDPQPARRRARGADPRGAGDLPGTQRPEGQQGHCQRAGPVGLVKFIKLPPVEKKRIPDIVKFEARQQIPFALEEVVWDYQQIGGDEEDGRRRREVPMAEVGLFAMKRDQIQRAILPFVAAGIEVDVVQLGPIALYNFIAFDRLRGNDAEKAAGSVVLLDIGADNTDLIITDGTRIWQRNVPIGGNHFTRALTKS